MHSNLTRQGFKKRTPCYFNLCNLIWEKTPLCEILFSLQPVYSLSLYGKNTILRFFSVIARPDKRWLVFTETDYRKQNTSSIFSLWIYKYWQFWLFFSDYVAVATNITFIYVIKFDVTNTRLGFVVGFFSWLGVWSKEKAGYRILCVLCRAQEYTFL